MVLWRGYSWPRDTRRLSHINALQLKSKWPSCSYSYVWYGRTDRDGEAYNISLSPITSNRNDPAFQMPCEIIPGFLVGICMHDDVKIVFTQLKFGNTTVFVFYVYAYTRVARLPHKKMCCFSYHHLT